MLITLAIVIKFVILDGNSTVTFRIGEGNCTTVYESCNDALKPNTEYAFKIRAFTRHGYRDSPTVTFITGGSHVSLKHSFINSNFQFGSAT